VSEWKPKRELGPLLVPALREFPRLKWEGRESRVLSVVEELLTQQLKWERGETSGKSGKRESWMR
jgi:hypothetical protein